MCVNIIPDLPWPIFASAKVSHDTDVKLIVHSLAFRNYSSIQWTLGICIFLCLSVRAHTDIIYQPSMQHPTNYFSIPSLSLSLSFLI